MPRLPLHLRVFHGIASVPRRLGDAWNRLIEPVESGFGWLADSAFSVFDNLEALESFVYRVFRVVLWPVTALFGALGWLLGRVFPSAADSGGLATLPGRVFESSVNGVLWLSEKLNLDGVLMLLVRLTTPLWWPVLSLLSFMNAWIATRRFKELALGAPVLLLAAPFAYVAVEASNQSQNVIAKGYKAEVRRALETGDTERARLMEIKLAQLGVDTRQADYKNALRLADEDRLDEAYGIMSRLAPIDSAGYAPAHAWIARGLLLGSITGEVEPAAGDSASAGRLAEEHLELAGEGGAAGPAFEQLRGYALAMQQRFGEAAEAFTPLAEQSRESATSRLVWLLAAGADYADETKKQAANLLTLYEAARDANLTTQECRAWYTAAKIVKDDRAMSDAMQAWQQTDAADLAASGELFACRRRQAETLLAQQTTNPVEVARRLIEASNGQTPPAWITTQMKRLVSQLTETRRAQAVVEAILASPESPWRLLEALGTAAAGSGEIPVARRALSLAVERGGQGASLNNYAWALSQPPAADLELALQTVDRALALRPADHRFRETRGQILISLRRWNEAASELEFALNGMPESAEIHRSLAVAYDAMSMPSLAEAHRRLATQ